MLTTSDDKIVASDYELAEGETEEDVSRSTENNDLIEGVTSSLSADKTLNNGDIIDGGAGTDTAKFSMKANFTGFTGDGKMENVENVELTNDSTIGRSFDAKGATGVEKYTVDAKGGDVELKNIDAAGITVDYSGEKAKAVKVGFTTDAVKGTADELTLKVTDLGTAAVEKTSTTSAKDAVYTDVTAKGIETLNVESKGSANLLNLSAANAAKAISVSGSADLDVEKVASTVTSFDAALSTGKVTADLTNVTAIKTVATGSGDDKITIDTQKALGNAELAGGEGADTVVLNNSGGSDTTLFSMSGFETIAVNAGLTSNVTYSATNTSDVSTIEATDLTTILKYVNAAGADLTIDGKVKAGGNSGSIETDNSGSTTVNLTAKAADITDKKGTTNNLQVTANETAELTVNVEEYVKYASGNTIGADKASAVTLNIASGKDDATKPAEVTDFSGTISADKAETITVNATGNLGKAAQAVINADEATSAVLTTKATAELDLQAAKLETLTITADKGIDLGGSDLAKVQTLEATTGAALVLDSNTDLSAAANITVTGNEADSEVTFSDIGAADLGYSTTITGTGFAKGFNATDIFTGKGADITVDLSAVTGDTVIAKIIAGATTATAESGNVTLNAGSAKTEITTAIVGKTVTINASDAMGTLSDSNTSPTAIAISAFESVTYNGTNLAKNEADIQITDAATAFTAVLNGGMENDTFNIASEDNGATLLEELTVSGDLGLVTAGGGGANEVDVAGGTSNAFSKLKIVDFSGIKGDKAKSTTTIDLSATLIDDLAKDVTFSGSEVIDEISITAAATAALASTGTVSIKDTTTGDADILKLSAAAENLSFTDLTLENIENIVVTATESATEIATINASAITGQTIDISGSAASQFLHLTGTDNADTIDLSAITTTTAIALNIDSKKGDDTITLSKTDAGIAETVVFGDTATNNGESTITNVKAAAAASAGDILNFDAFVDVDGVAGNTTGGGGTAVNNNTGTAVVTGGVETGSTLDIADKVVFLDSDDYADTDAIKAAVADSTGASKMGLANAAEAVIIYGDFADGEQTFEMYYMTGAAGATDTLELVGTVTVDDGDALVANQFIVA